MSKIINIKVDYHHDPEYRGQLEACMKRLEEIQCEIQDMATNLACAGAWKGWNNTKKEGDVVHFSDEALGDTGDPNVDGLLGLCGHIRRTLVSIR